MSTNITSVHDNYFSAGLTAYIAAASTSSLLVGATGINTIADYADESIAGAGSVWSDACIAIRRNDLGLTYDRGILIPFTSETTNLYYNFYPRITIVATTAHKLKCAARIKILKGSYDTSPISMTVGIGLAGADVAAVDTSFLVNSDEGWIDLTIIGICAGAGGTINFKLGQFDTNPDCFLLCDNWNAEIFDA